MSDRSAENDAACPTCGSPEFAAGVEGVLANYCPSCGSYWRVIPPAKGDA